MNVLSLFLWVAVPAGQVALPPAAAAHDTTFWDGEWRRVSRNNAVYYGWVARLDSSRCLVQNFYRTGEREMEAAARLAGPTVLKEGPVTYFYRSGSRRATGQFANNKREGSWSYWREDGSLRLQKSFMAGIEVRLASAGPPPDPDSRVPQLVEIMPKFLGPGSVGQYLANTTHRPAQAPAIRGDGKVFVQFVVGPEGTITSTRIIKGFDPAYDAEALRAVAALPRWQPGSHNGQPVAVRFVVPITFK